MFNLAKGAIMDEPYTRNFKVNEFVANALRDNIGSKKKPQASFLNKKLIVLNFKNLGSG